MSAINRDTRAALACTYRIHDGKAQTVHLFGGFPSAAVQVGTYDRVNGRWVLRADGGSVALQHRPLSSGALRSPGALGAKPRCVKCDGSGKLTMRGGGWERGRWNQRRRVTATLCCVDCGGTGEAGPK